MQLPVTSISYCYGTTLSCCCVSIGAALQVRALKQCSKELPDRWEHIAAMVGQPKAACQKQFKAMRASVRAGKGQ